MPKLRSGDLLVSMCVEGRALNSPEFSKLLDGAAVSGKSGVTFLIGGSYGLSDGLKKRADICVSFSRMTFPHELARVILLEQIYRGYQILSGGKYHK